MAPCDRAVCHHVYLPGIARLICSICLYVAATAWYSGAGQTHSRRAAVVIAALATAAELVSFVGLRVSALPILAAIFTAVGASVGAAPPFWEIVVVLAILLWLLVRWSPVCCGRHSTACCCTCAPKESAMRASALPGVLMRLSCTCAAFLLLPALAAQSDVLSCLPSTAVATGARVYAFNRYLATVDNGGAAEAPGGAQPLLFRSSRDANASYAAWLSSSRELFFAGTHTAKMLALDLTVTPRTLHFNGSTCADVTIHSGFYEVYSAVREDVLSTVRAALTANASAPVFVGGFSLGAAVAPLAALDLVCSGVASPTQLILYYMAGPGVCSGDACANAFDSLQDAGLHITRVVNVFDFVTWLPAFLFEPLRTPAGRTHLTFTSAGQFMLAAHQGAGYVPAPVVTGCGGLRALAWVPAIIAATLAVIFAAARPRIAAQVRGDGAVDRSADGAGGAGGATTIAQSCQSPDGASVVFEPKVVADEI